MTARTSRRWQLAVIAPFWTLPFATMCPGAQGIPVSLDALILIALLATMCVTRQWRQQTPAMVWPVARLRSRWALLAVVLALAIAAPAFASTVERLCREPLDISGTTDVPSFLRAIKERDEIAYPAHVALGWALQERSCASAATALQWVKAAAHARSDREVTVAAQGLAAALATSDDQAALARELCAKVRDDPVRPALARAMVEASLDCSR